MLRVLFCCCTAAPRNANVTRSILRPPGADLPVVAGKTTNPLENESKFQEADDLIRGASQNQGKLATIVEAGRSSEPLSMQSGGGGGLLTKSAAKRLQESINRHHYDSTTDNDDTDAADSRDHRIVPFNSTGKLTLPPDESSGGNYESTSISIASQLSNEFQQNLTDVLKSTNSPKPVFGLARDSGNDQTGTRTSPSTVGAALTSVSQDSLASSNIWNKKNTSGSGAMTDSYSGAALADDQRSLNTESELRVGSPATIDTEDRDVASPDSRKSKSLIGSIMRVFRPKKSNSVKTKPPKQKKQKKDKKNKKKKHDRDTNIGRGELDGTDCPESRPVSV